MHQRRRANTAMAITSTNQPPSAARSLWAAATGHRSMVSSLVPQPASRLRRGRLDSAQEPRIVLEPVLELVLLGSEPDQHGGRLAMPCDHDLFILGLPLQQS